MGTDSNTRSDSLGQGFEPSDWIEAAKQFGYRPDITPGDIRYWDGTFKLAEVLQRARQLNSHRKTPERAGLRAVAADICAILDLHCGHDGDGLVYDHEAIGEEVARLHEKLTTALTPTPEPRHD